MVSCCTARCDGGFMPQLLDPVPLPSRVQLRDIGGTRMMRFGAAGNGDIAPDIVPNGGFGTTKKELYSRRDRPWNSRAKPKEFSRFAHMTDGGGDGNDGNSNLKRAPNRNNNNDQENEMKKLPPMRCPKPDCPYLVYPYIEEQAAPQVYNPFAGTNLRMGKAPGVFDQHIYSGPSMLSAQPLKGASLRDSLSAMPAKIGHMTTNLKKKDTFGAYPAHLADPFLDNPLGDGRGNWAKSRPGFYTHSCRAKPCMPIVNVWDPSHGMQMKAGVRKGIDSNTGENTNYLTDVGRLGTTV